MTKYEVELDDSQLEAAKNVLPGVEFVAVGKEKPEEPKPASEVEEPEPEED